MKIGMYVGGAFPHIEDLGNCDFCSKHSAGVLPPPERQTFHEKYTKYIGCRRGGHYGSSTKSMTCDACKCVTPGCTRSRRHRSIQNHLQRKALLEWSTGAAGCNHVLQSHCVQCARSHAAGKKRKRSERYERYETEDGFVIEACRERASPFRRRSQLG